MLLLVPRWNVVEKAVAPHSSTLAWKIPWTEEPGRLQSKGSIRVGHDWAISLFTFHFHALEKEMTTHSSVLAWRIPGTGEPGGLLSMGSHRVGHDWSDLAAGGMLSYHHPKRAAGIPAKYAYVAFPSKENFNLFQQWINKCSKFQSYTASNKSRGFEITKNGNDKSHYFLSA